jgi:hypothetical protein
MKKIYVLLWGLLVSLQILQAQDEEKKELFKILKVETDTTTYPQIKVTIQLNNNIQPLKTDFRIEGENGEKGIEILTFEKKGDDSVPLSSRLVYFLIDASNYTDGIPIQNFKTAIKESLPLLSDNNDFINVGFFGNGELTSFSRDFSNNFPLMESDIETRITASLDSAANTDIFKYIYDAMDKMQDTQREGQKMLIVISGGVFNNASNYNTETIVDRAKKLGITIHTLNYKINNQFSPDAFRIISNRTEGITKIVNSSTAIKNEMGNILEQRPTANTDAPNATPIYELTFDYPEAKRDGRDHSFTVFYNNTQQRGEFIAPGGSSGGGSFIANYGLIILIILGLAGGLGYWQLNEMRLRRLEQEEMEAEMEAQREAEERRREQEKQGLLQDLQEKNIRLQEQLRMKEQELAKKVDEFPTVIPASKIDLKNTIIAGGGSAPIFQVVAGAFSKNYRLNKPTMTIGRAANNDIVIPEQTVSSRHATITIENGSFFLNDLGSTNGTFVNGTRIDKKLLKAGDIIKMGAANCRFELE